MTKLVKALIALVAVVLAIVLAQPRQTEIQRLKKETSKAAERAGLVRSNKVSSSPGLALELIVRRPRDPEGFYTARFYEGMTRLRDLGVIEKRTFHVCDTNGSPLKFSIAEMFDRGDVLWEVEHFTNGYFGVVAQDYAMARWAELQQRCESNFAAAHQSVTEPSVSR